jgi:alanine dehydrogenase
MKTTLLGLLRETKSPPDRRVPLTPRQCRMLQNRHRGLRILVQPSPHRCFSDESYRAEGIRLEEDLSRCDLLVGVKEVKLETLLDGKTYLFFSHTAKKQPHNRELLRMVVEKGIRLIDYEYMTGSDGMRLVAFGRWAGLAGAFNGLRALGFRSGRYELQPPRSFPDLEKLKSALGRLDAGRTRIAVTGGGRVAGGALEVLRAAGIREADPAAYLSRSFPGAVFTRLDPWHYTRRRDGSVFDFANFTSHPGLYENAFLPYAFRSDMFFACHYWDPRSPILLTREDLAGGRIPIRVIADISCDIGGPIASTLRASTIADPFYGYDPITGSETGPFEPGSITVMSVDNLPGEMPCDASEDFGNALSAHVLPELLGIRNTGVVERACITENGRLTGTFAFLRDYLEG